MTPTENRPLSETITTPIQGRLDEDVNLEPSPHGAADTHSPPSPAGRTVPSTETTGKVWLRYSVQQVRYGTRETSTQG